MTAPAIQRGLEPNIVGYALLAHWVDIGCASTPRGQGPKAAVVAIDSVAAPRGQRPKVVEYKLIAQVPPRAAGGPESTG